MGVYNWRFERVVTNSLSRRCVALAVVLYPLVRRGRMDLFFATKCKVVPF